MDNINWSFSSKFGGHWIKVKFYKEKPNLKEFKKLEGVRFCEATKKAIIYPVLLDKESISCSGAQYAFGWRPGYKDELLNSCRDKRQVSRNILESMLLQIPHFKKPFKYIGLNTEGGPDLLISYLPPEKIMNLIKIYHNQQGESLDVSLFSMMSICGSVAVKTFLDKEISISFGCDDSRKYADMRRENLAVGIPRRLFSMFLD